MPRRQVYGKRTQKATGTYTKFLSPDKDDIVQPPNNKSHDARKHASRTDHDIEEQTLGTGVIVLDDDDESDDKEKLEKKKQKLSRTSLRKPPAKLESRDSGSDVEIVGPDAWTAAHQPETSVRSGRKEKTKSRKARGKKEREMDLAIGELQDGFMALKLGDRQIERLVMQEKKDQSSKEVIVERPKRRIAVAVVVDRSSERISLGDDKIHSQQVQTKSRKIRQRKILANRSANADSVDTNQEVEIGKGDGKERKIVQGLGQAKDERAMSIENNTIRYDSEAIETARLVASMTINDTDEEDIKPKKGIALTSAESQNTSQSKNRLPRPSPAMMPADDIHYHYVSPLLSRSDQRRIVSFEEWSSRLDEYVEIEKIAEASFSEVYRLSVRDARHVGAVESVLKVVALKSTPDSLLPRELLNDQRSKRGKTFAQQLDREHREREEQDKWKSKVQDVLSEVKLLQNLNHIPGFATFRELTILQGRPTASFARAWKAWNKVRPKGKKSEFPDPSKKNSYEDAQLWAVIEMQDAGTDCGKVMEAGGIRTIWEVWDVFWGVCLSVAKAEEGCRFEHRDLHMDNICIRSSTSDESLTERRIKNPCKRKLGFTGLETTVIDYTLSRADIVNVSPSGTPGSFMSHSSPGQSASSNSLSDLETEVAYLDLNHDPALFEGDAEEEYQYEIYRYMRGAVLYDDPLKTEAPALPVEEHEIVHTPRDSPRKHHADDAALPETPRRSPRKSQPYRPATQEIWKHFVPKTNLVWAHFVLHNLLQRLPDNDGSRTAQLTTTEIMHNIDAPVEESARIQKKACTMLKILRKVGDLLEPHSLGPKSRLKSVKDLVVLALEAKWLSEDDVRGGIS